MLGGVALVALATSGSAFAADQAPAMPRKAPAAAPAYD